MSRFAIIGDVHANMETLERVLARVEEVGVDAILLVGDLGSHHLGMARRRTPERDALYLASVEAVLERCGRLGVPVRYVPGNHDLPDLSLPGNLDGVCETLAGWRVVGFGGAGPSRFGFCYEWTDEQARARLTDLPAFDLLLAHCPPARTPLDWVPRGLHVGSEALRELAERSRGVMVCGHIHESPGAAQLGDCLVLNAGGLGEPFGKAQVAFVEGPDRVIHEDLEAGVRRVWGPQGQTETSTLPSAGA